MATVAKRKFEPDFVLKQAELRPSGRDVTGSVIGWLGVSSPPYIPDGERLRIRYTYKGSGPYAYYAQTFPPAPSEREMTPADEQIIMAEHRKPDEDDGYDVTDEIVAFAGPDGRFHGNFEDPTVFVDGFDDDDTLVFTFANGNVRDVSRKKSDVVYDRCVPTAPAEFWTTSRARMRPFMTGSFHPTGISISAVMLLAIVLTLVALSTAFCMVSSGRKSLALKFSRFLALPIALLSNQYDQSTSR